ncbi:hypothetical protein KPHES18084_04520 [Corynebacterium ulcerans]|nr:hypothetical protein CULTSU28_05580 [Corynebacterium ulcerans]STC78218.1 Uncharacterised protein [Corynebacterium ulcerans]
MNLFVDPAVVLCEYLSTGTNPLARRLTRRKQCNKIVMIAQQNPPKNHPKTGIVGNIG